MYIESVQLKNFRNYENLELKLDKGTNIFYGDNAQGKTNILESVYICGTTKSHKGSKDREIIRFGEENKTRNVTRDCSWCPYHDICYTEMTGGDVQYVIGRDFKEREH